MKAHLHESSILRDSCKITKLILLTRGWIVLNHPMAKIWSSAMRHSCKKLQFCCSRPPWCPAPLALRSSLISQPQLQWTVPNKLRLDLVWQHPNSSRHQSSFSFMVQGLLQLQESILSPWASSSWRFWRRLCSQEQPLTSKGLLPNASASDPRADNSGIPSTGLSGSVGQMHPDCPWERALPLCHSPSPSLPPSGMTSDTHILPAPKLFSVSAVDLHFLKICLFRGNSWN